MLGEAKPPYVIFKLALQNGKRKRNEKNYILRIHLEVYFGCIFEGGEKRGVTYTKLQKFIGKQTKVKKLF